MNLELIKDQIKHLQFSPWFPFFSN
jgi:hypothetical protein